MSVHYDDKGKFFTPVISKDDVSVIIQTGAHRIRGKMYVRPDERIKDELNKNEQFLAITDANVFDMDGNLLYSTEFIAVNRDQVVWVVPQEELATDSREGDQES